MAAKVGLLNAICAKLKTDIVEHGSREESPTLEGEKLTKYGTPFSSYCTSPETVQDLSTRGQDLSLQGTPVQAHNQSQQGTPSADGERSSQPDTPRKNRRKAAAPRCLKLYDEELSYQKDELDEFEANNKDVDFAAYTGDLDENSNELDDDDDDDGSDMMNGSDSFHDGDVSGEGEDDDDDRSYTREDSESNPYLDLDTADENSNAFAEDGDFNMQHASRSKSNPVDDNGVIDLSVQKVQEVAASPVSRPRKVETKLERLPKHSGVAADLKDYAESTMNELLSMYGLGDSGSMAAQPSLKSFSGATVDHHIGGHQEGRPFHRVGPSSHSSDIYAKYADSETKQSEEAPGSISQTPAVPKPASSKSSTPPGESLSNSKAANGNQGSSSIPVGTNRFVESAAYVRACFSKDIARPSSSKSESGSGSGKSLLPDYAKYIKRFSGFEECKGSHCQDMMYREHYHCMDCSFKVFVKKEEMIRHFKWHKKRDDSLQHGFMRYSPLDDCSERFSECTHNKKQTHYHCLQSGCNKVYISTSDVQMHANYHRKDSAIIQEGFQRFRATEDCGTTSCQFYGQRTTHFHCRRSGCNFTFKNKADMEKHKTYHQKDEVLTKDGFKKFMKYEHCTYSHCKYSKISNHIHCIRPGCNYVLHSTGQLYSHKRKHERRDFEFAYKRFKQEGDDKGGSSNDATSVSTTPSPAPVPVRPIPQQMVIPTPLPHPLLLPQPLTLPLEQQAMLSDAQKALMAAIGLRSSQGIPPKPNDPEYVDLEDLKNYDKMDSGASTPRSGAGSPNPAIVPSVSHSKTTAELHQRQIQSAFARYASVLKNIELNDSLSLPIPNFMAKERTREPPVMPSVTPGGVAVKEEPRASTPVKVKQEPDEEAPGDVQSLLQRPLPKIMEKKERDESWKKYMIRYTANDPCRARCSMLYKDHYHCSVEGCDAMYYTKERVREHARLHDQDEKVSEHTFHTTSTDHPCCVEGCRIDGEKHYHCLWPDCDQVVKATDPPLTRLKHHRYHEHERANQNVKWTFARPQFSSDGLLRRKRGRPPKYPKDEIPSVPKVNVKESDIFETSTPVNVKLSRDMFLASPQKLVNGFKMFEAGRPCPDELCAYFLKEHFHCVRPRCHHVTNSADVMNLHAREFHNYVSIMEGFEFFDRGVNCRRPHCQNNKTNRHFHCIRPRCDYAFVRHSTMFQHDKKHQEGYKPPKPADEPEKQAKMSPDDPQSKTVIKASGTFYPMSTIPLHKSIAPKTSSGNTAQIPIKVEPSLMRPIASIPPFMSTSPPASTSQVFINMATSAAMFNIASLPTAIPFFTAPIMAFPTPSLPAPSIIPPTSSSPPLTSGEITLQQASAAAEALKDLGSSTAMASPSHKITEEKSGRPSLPLSVLLQRKTAHAPKMESWQILKSKMHYILNQNCGRPFCKLKKRDHYHCLDCNQAFSDPERLKTHVGRHGIKFERSKKLRLTPGKPYPPRNGVLDEEEDLSPGGDHLNSSLNLNGEEFSNMMADAQKDAVPQVENTPEADNDATNDSLDGSFGNLEIDLDSTAELNSSTEDATCRRSGRKRSHTQNMDFMDSDAIVIKQRRVTSPRVYKDEPVPEGYIRYWAHEDCGRRGCSYRQSTTHYHCKRPSCGFGICSRVRIEQHTIRHQRIDKITGEDFEQYRANLDCGFKKCLYSNQATHFHCLKCSFTCTDTIKVTTHRKQHNKKDFFVSQGFQKFSQSQACGKDECKHNQRQTHYHCIVCNASVVGQSQMAPHRLKHAGLGRFNFVNMTDTVANAAKASAKKSAVEAQ